MKITLCGSTRFKTHFMYVNAILSLSGHIVSMPVFIPNDIAPISDEQRDMLHSVHMCKIKDSDAIFIIDFDGYIGDSTKKEVEYAKSEDKKVFYFSDNDYYRI